jgi:hypothetical protein
MTKLDDLLADDFDARTPQEAADDYAACSRIADSGDRRTALGAVAYARGSTDRTRRQPFIHALAEALRQGIDDEVHLSIEDFWALAKKTYKECEAERAAAEAALPPERRAALAEQRAPAPVVRRNRARRELVAKPADLARLRSLLADPQESLRSIEKNERWVLFLDGAAIQPSARSMARLLAAERDDSTPDDPLGRCGAVVIDEARNGSEAASVGSPDAVPDTEDE